MLPRRECSILGASCRGRAADGCEELDCEDAGSGHPDAIGGALAAPNTENPLKVGIAGVSVGNLANADGLCARATANASASVSARVCWDPPNQAQINSESAPNRHRRPCSVTFEARAVEDRRDDSFNYLRMNL